MQKTTSRWDSAVWAGEEAARTGLGTTATTSCSQSMGSRYNQPTSASHFYTEHSPEQFYRRMYHYFGILFNVCTVQSE